MAYLHLAALRAAGRAGATSMKTPIHRFLSAALAFVALAGCARDEWDYVSSLDEPPLTADEIDYSQPTTFAGVQACDFIAPASLPSTDLPPVIEPRVPLGPTACRWVGDGLTITAGLDTGPDLPQISADPRYRPGFRDGPFNTAWTTCTGRTSDVFVALSPGGPDLLLHIHVDRISKGHSPSFYAGSVAGRAAALIPRAPTGTPPR